jgi:hypothetical protein
MIIEKIERGRRRRRKLKIIFVSKALCFLVISLILYSYR